MTGLTPHSRNKCPHCQTVVHFEEPKYSQSQNENPQYLEHLFKSPARRINVSPSFCPDCLKLIITLDDYVIKGGSIKLSTRKVVWPLTSGRALAPSDVPQNISQDFNEAILVITLSPKASAALSRRCLQNVLAEAGGTKKKNLSEQIVEVLPNLPGYIAPDLDYVREIGNFAAHEQKSTNTGAILDVEPGEAEWNLDVLDDLFDFYYVKPKNSKVRREDFNKKLAEAGRKPISVELEEEDTEEKS